MPIAAEVGDFFDEVKIRKRYFFEKIVEKIRILL